MNKVRVTIEKLSVGGDGITHIDGLVCFVPDSAPGDQLEIEVTEKKGNFSRGRILEILSPSPSRRKPPCEFAGSCGGCNWQHITEEEQLRQKASLLKETLHKFLGIHPFPDFEFVKSPKSLRYRNRIQPRVQGKSWGYFSRNSHNFTPVSDCLLFENDLKDFKPPESPIDTRFEIFVGQKQETAWRFLEGESSYLFSQVNRLQNNDLIAWVTSKVQAAAIKNIIDLFSGAGNFSLPLAQLFPRVPVIAVEQSTALTIHGQKEAQLRGSTNLSFFNSDVETFLRMHPPQDNSLVLVDPPRAGLSSEVCLALSFYKPQKILYVSCNPVTLARDIRLILDNAAGTIEVSSLRGFEMFPQTDHMEIVAELNPC